MVSIVFELWHSVSKCSYGRRAFFLLLRRFFEKVFLSILRMLDHWTFLEDS